MENRCYAAIDIGSNAVRLLIKKENAKESRINRRLTKALLVRVPLRLGFDVFSRGKVSREKEEKLIRLMRSYKQLMRIYEVTDFRACATSAMRDATNGKSVIRKIRWNTGINIEVIDGQEEALMIYNNHLECLEDRKGNYIYVDVGGGSTEINLLSGGKLKKSLSYNVGTVRILSNAVEDETWRKMYDDLTSMADNYQDINIIGSGGNINKLYRLAETKDKKRQRISIDTLRKLYDTLLPYTPEERMEKFGLKADRADVIVPAAEIFLMVADVVRADYIHVPVIGLADGIIDNLYAKRPPHGEN